MTLDGVISMERESNVGLPEPGKAFHLTDADLHPHLRARMAQRGVTAQEIERTLIDGWQATDARPGTPGKVLVFSHAAEWEGKYYREKQVTVYYKQMHESIVVLTVIARYGQEFPRG